MSMWSDFFSKLKKEDLVVKASLAEREAEVLRKAQEIVNEYSKIAGIEPPRVIEEKSKKGSYFYQPNDHTVGVPLPHAMRVTEGGNDRQLRAILAHEIGHAQDYENSFRDEKHKEQNRQILKGLPLVLAGLAVSQGGAAASLGIPPEIGTLAFVGGTLIMGNVVGLPAEMREESRADRFAIETIGIDPVDRMQVQVEFGRKKGFNNKEPSFEIIGRINEHLCRPPSPYLQEAFKERLAELGSDAKLPFRVPSRYAQPAEPKKVETSSTGRITGGGRFSRPPSPEAIAQARQEPPPRARSSGRSM